MVKATVGYLGASGAWVPVAHDTPLPTTGDGGGGGGAVDSVNGQTGTVVLDAVDVDAIPESDRGTAGGVATLDGSGRLSTAQEPSALAAATDVPTAGTLVKRDSTGAFEVPEPTVDEHPTPKVYVDTLADPVYGELARTTIPAIRISPGVGGVTADGTTGDSTAIQNAIDNAQQGATLSFAPLSTGAYVIDSTLTIDKPMRFLGPGFTRYYGGMKVASGVPVGIDVRSGMVTFENVNLYGEDGGNLGTGATQIGIDLWGTPLGDVDARIIGGNFSYFATGVKTHGRNLHVTAAIFSNSLGGVHSVGMDTGGYHSGAASTVVRGVRIENTRFHGIGDQPNTDAAFCIKISDHDNFQHGSIQGNYSDAGPYGRGLWVAGTSGAPVYGLQVANNLFAEHRGSSMLLQYVSDFQVNGHQVYGAGTLVGRNSVDLLNCTKGLISNVFVRRAGGIGFRVQSSSDLGIFSSRVQDAGLISTGTSGNAFQVASDSSNIMMDGLFASGASGWGLLGSPTSSQLGTRKFLDTALGGLSSSTLT